MSDNPGEGNILFYRGFLGAVQVLCDPSRGGGDYQKAHFRSQGVTVNTHSIMIMHWGQVSVWIGPPGCTHRE